MATYQLSNFLFVFFLISVPINQLLLKCYSHNLPLATNNELCPNRPNKEISGTTQFQVAIARAVKRLLFKLHLCPLQISKSHNISVIKLILKFVLIYNINYIKHFMRFYEFNTITMNIFYILKDGLLLKIIHQILKLNFKFC